MVDHVVGLQESLGQRNHNLAQTDTDQGLAERRRKRQRLAQRQYRARKENEMSNLQKRIRELEGAIEETSTAISTFCDMLMQSNVLNRYPRITQVLHQVTEKCLSLARASHPDSTAEAIAKGLKIYDGIQSAVSRPMDEGNESTGVFVETSEQMNGDSYGMNSKRKSQRPPLLHTLSPSGTDQAVLVPNIADSISDHTDSSPRPPTLVSFPDIFSTYLSHKEQATFSQSLIRACLRNGLRLLTDPYSSLENIKRVFGSRFTDSDRHRMTGLLRDTLRGMNANTVPLSSEPKTVGPQSNIYQGNLQESSGHSWEPPVPTQTDKNLLDAYTIQQMLGGRGIATDSGDSFTRVQTPAGSSVFHVRSFITFLSEVPICAGNELRFERYHVEAALRSAIKN